MLSEQGLAELVGLMLSGGLDAILGPRPPANIDLQSVAVWSERLSAVTPGVCAAATSVWMKSLGGHVWILPDSTALPGFAGEVEQLLRAKGMNRIAGVTVATPATLTRQVAAGAGAGLLPGSLARPMDGVSIRPLRDPDAIATTWLTILKGDCPSLKRFRELVEKAASEPQRPVEV